VGIAQNIVVKPYLQDASSTEITIMWEVDSIGNGEVNYGPDLLEMNSIQQSFSASGSGLSQIHTATLNSLIAGSKYYYKIVMTEGQSSQIYSFVTPYSHTSEMPTQLMAISDMQRDGSHPNKFQEIVEEGIIPIIYSEIGPSLNELEAVVIPGDLVATGGIYDQWKDHFFIPSDSLFPYVPVYPVPGNHEYISGGLPNFIKYFTLPDNAPAGLSDQCWYKDISNVRIIGLNSNSGTADQSLQLNWLGELLDSTCSTEHIDFVFAQLHHPYKSELWTPGESSFTGKIVDSLESFTSDCDKASIHFFGHTHAYSRGQSRDHKHLWINVATSGGAIDNWGEFPNADYEEFVKSQDEYGFVMVDVQAGNEPQFTIKRFSRGDQNTIINNELRDELTIYKNEWSPSRPLNIFPIDGDTSLSICLILKGSDFWGIEDSLQASHWEIAKGGNFTDSLIASNWYQSENYYYEVNLQANDDLTDASFESIPGNNLYHWRVRYRNQNLEWSPWSVPTTFYLENTGDTLSGNLIQNKGAENGVLFWTGDIEALMNAECNSVNPYQGNYNFAVGGVCANESSVGYAYQSIDLSPYETEISSGNASIRFGSYMRNFGNSDIPEMYLEFYKEDELISTTTSVSNATGTWLYIEDVVPVPESSNLCRIVLKGTRNAGADNDSYFDELQFQVVETTDCANCFGSSNIDIDQDGFCDDIDCNDLDPDIYPGANETCDTKDNNCDGIYDTGSIVSWTGNGGDDLWSNASNWDQLMVPLTCQYVHINSTATVTIDNSFACKGIDVGVGGSLIIESDGFLSINSQNDNPGPSAIIRGNMFVNGRCDVRSSSDIAFEVFGVLINTNKVNAMNIQEESILVRPGGRFESFGTTILR
jgi:hypothetical protein